MDDSPEGMYQPPMSEVGLLRDLALRLLSTHDIYGRRGYAKESLEILPGQLPLISGGAEGERGMPEGVPMPAESTVIGSLRTVNEGYLHYVILLSSYSYADDIIYGYAAQLESQGWHVPANDRHRANARVTGGFTDYGTKRLYCKGDDGPSLEVSAAELSGRDTEIRIEIKTDPRSQLCKPSTERLRRTLPNDVQIIPALNPHRAAHVGPNGISVRANCWEANVVLTTELDLPTLLDHYNNQLEQAGWTRTTEGASGPITWSRWLFSDPKGNRWTGTFLAIQHDQELAADDDRYFLEIYTYKIEDGAPET